MSNKQSGDRGEAEVCELVPCPNCGSELMQLPPMYPLVDLQCTRCLFRVQVKSANSRPKNEVFGAGWDIYEKVFKAGHLPAPLIINYKWTEQDIEKQEIRFYPFIPKKNIRKRTLSENHKTRPGYRMYNYTGLDKLPHFVVYKK